MLEQYEMALDNWIENVVSNGDDDALFASGYLQGHIAVVLSELEVEGDSSLPALDSKIEVCMELAKDELEEDDLQLVKSAWSELRTDLELLK
ncbi:YfcL family protein [Parashewanella curva]|uniref:YfcL family protein n=1 Tax=Parashewanella curva TaxID=2338552 RepID=A0A3L8Q0U5_9GAMM|nr:YfcL family protein [Parashewanella curva]RLV60343.1 YfcL family protein [Parashewanella curva]